MQATLSGRDIYLRHTATDGKSYVQEHRVWDAERFVEAQDYAVSKANAEARAEKKKAMANVEQITREQYLAERKAR